MMDEGSFSKEAVNWPHALAGAVGGAIPPALIASIRSDPENRLRNALLAGGAGAIGGGIIGHFMGNMPTFPKLPETPTIKSMIDSGQISVGGSPPDPKLEAALAYGEKLVNEHMPKAKLPAPVPPPSQEIRKALVDVVEKNRASVHPMDKALRRHGMKYKDLEKDLYKVLQTGSDNYMDFLNAMPGTEAQKKALYTLAYENNLGVPRPPWIDIFGQKISSFNEETKMNENPLFKLGAEIAIGEITKEAVGLGTAAKYLGGAAALGGAGYGGYKLYQHLKNKQDDENYGAEPDYENLGALLAMNEAGGDDSYGFYPGSEYGYNPYLFGQ